MKVLNLLTGTASTGCAISTNGEILIELSIESGIRQSETIFKMIKDAFTYIDMTMDDIDAVSVLNGPGSFTGLRVGFAAAKAISFAKNIPIIPVNTLDAIYCETQLKTNVTAMIDARRGRVYLKDFRDENALDRVVDLNELPVCEKRTFVFGEGLQKYRDILESKGYVLDIKGDVFLGVRGLVRAAVLVESKDYEDARSSHLNYLKSKEEIVCK